MGTIHPRGIVHDHCKYMSTHAYVHVRACVCMWASRSNRMQAYVPIQLAFSLIVGPAVVVSCIYLHLKIAISDVLSSIASLSGFLALPRFFPIVLALAVAAAAATATAVAVAVAVE